MVCRYAAVVLVTHSRAEKKAGADYSAYDEGAIRNMNRSCAVSYSHSPMEIMPTVAQHESATTFTKKLSSYCVYERAEAGGPP